VGLCGVERFFHERFVREYDRFVAPFERAAFREARARIAASARGRVLDIGAGTGANFAYFTAADTVTAIDPEPRMLAQSTERALASRAPVALAVADGELLPFPSQTFDTVVATLVLCTIPSARRALSEIRRVLKPGGRLLALEHVRSTSRALAALQTVATPVQRIIAGGCELDRDTVAEVITAHFTIQNLRRRFAGALVEIDALRED